MELVLEDNGLHFNAIHEDDPDFSVRVYGALVVGFGVKSSPIHDAVLHLHRLLFKGIHPSVASCSCLRFL